MNKKPETAFPVVDPRVSSPRASAYAAGLAARKAMPPIGGGPVPPIPVLSREFSQDGPPMPMSAHALQERKMAAVGTLAQDPNSIIMGPSVPPMSSPQGGLLPNDILPDAAKQDPHFQEGAGSMYAINQPHLARKYGVMRQGNFVPPQALAANPSSGRSLSPKTIQGLEEVARFQKMREENEKKAERDTDADAAKGVAGAAATIVNMPGDTDTKPLSEEERKKVAQDAVHKLDDFDFDTFRQMMMKDILNNPEQRAIVEERLTPMDIGDLVADGSIKQDVIIIPKKFWATFRSTSAAEDLAIKRLIVQESRTVHVDERYYLDKFAIMALTLGLFAINGNPIPGHTDEKGNFNDDAFWVKFNHVSRLNIHMCASLGLHFFWFDSRVRGMFKAERIKNG